MTSLDRRSPMPLWAQLADRLRAAIAEGAFRDRFPTDEQLSQRYGVSRNTVREAVRRLSDEGLVERHRGRGTFLSTPAIEQPLRGLYSLARSIEAQGLEERSEVVALELQPAGERAKELDLAADDQVVHVERLRFAGVDPLALDRSWLPARVARPLLEADLTHGSVYDALDERCHVRPTGGWERIRPVIPGPHDRVRLGLGRQAALAVDRLVRAGAQPIEWRESLVRGDRYSFVLEWEVGSG